MILNKNLIDEGKKQRIKESSLSLSEVMTIVILFHGSDCRHFKAYYIEYKIFKELAKQGKNSVGRFYGFKLHIVINEYGELSAFKLTPGKTDDRKPVPDMTGRLSGKIFGDRCYISQKLFEDLFEKGIQLITKIRKNMKKQADLLLTRYCSGKEQS